MTFSQFSANYRKRLVREGKRPIKAVYDDAGNCRICGESGRCPGWHYDGEPGTTPAAEALSFTPRGLFDSINKGA